MKIEQKIIDRFQQLIDVEPELMKTRKSGGGTSIVNPYYDFVSPEMANQWGLNCLHLLKKVYGVESDYYTKFNEKFSEIKNPSIVKKLLGILKAGKEDFELGLLFDTRIAVEAEVFDDFLEQAEHLQKNKFFAPAAVVAGSVLEDGLRKLCLRNGISLSAKPKLDGMNSELAKAGIYNTLTQKKITALADLRNKAAHGKWSDFTSADVEQMIIQIRNFMETHFS